MTNYITYICKNQNCHPAKNNNPCKITIEGRAWAFSPQHDCVLFGPVITTNWQIADNKDRET